MFDESPDGMNGANGGGGCDGACGGSGGGGSSDGGGSGGGGGGGAEVGDTRCDWREIDRKMRRLASRRAALDADEARLLVAAKRAEIHKHLGFGTFDEYLERVLGYAPTTGRDKLRVAESLESLPAIATALARGTLSYSAVREITRVAKPHNDAEWADYVVGMTVREIEQLVRCKAPGDGPDERPRPDLEPRVVRMQLPPATYALFLEARRTLEREHGHSMTDADFMAMVCRAVVAGDRCSDVVAGDRGAGAERGNKPAHQIAITVCADCKRGWHDAPGRSIELPPAAIERARCDAVEIGRVDASATLQPRGTRTIPAHIRRAVLARDKHRCVVPGCTSSRYVDVHHIVHWLHGGTHDPLNLVTLCGLHHDAHHDGVIRISGDASALRVTHSDGRPYGTPPPARARELRPRVIDVLPSTSADARSALVNLGFRPAEAAAAVERAFAHVGEAGSLEQPIRVALRETSQPRPR